MISCVKKYLSDLPKDKYPKVCVIGMAGPVDDNTIKAVNIKHWVKTDGNRIASEMGFQSFLFINDFTAAGYGISIVKESDCKALGDSGKISLNEGANSVSAYITHGVLSGPAIERLQNSKLKELVITDSIAPTKLILDASNIRIINLAPLIAEAIRRISSDSSVSSLFD